VPTWRGHEPLQFKSAAKVFENRVAGADDVFRIIPEQGPATLHCRAGLCGVAPCDLRQAVNTAIHLDDHASVEPRKIVYPITQCRLATKVRAALVEPAQQRPHCALTGARLAATKPLRAFDHGAPGHSRR